jgi:anti-sigma regulatory factor (Ser/Thr protein kinase)
MGESMELKVKPKWEDADMVRDRSNDFLMSHGVSHDIAYALSMTACELFENAVKYGHFRSDDEAINVTVEVSKNDIIVEVKNPAGAMSEDLQQLDNTFQAYIERLKEVSEKKLKEGESGLGLVRIAYEGQAVLDFYVDENNVLAVSAVYQM